MEWLITLAVGLACIAGIVAAVFLAACIHAFCTDHADPRWMKWVGGVATLAIVALVIGAMVRFG